VAIARELVGGAVRREQSAHEQMTNSLNATVESGLKIRESIEIGDESGLSRAPFQLCLCLLAGGHDVQSCKVRKPGEMGRRLFRTLADGGPSICARADAGRSLLLPRYLDEYWHEAVVSVAMNRWRETNDRYTHPTLHELASRLL
jgi:hypothetical protein